jgi:UDP-N-acetylglucosamine pyrophosphorylase
MENVSQGSFAGFATRMQEAGLSDAAIRGFEHCFRSLEAGKTGMIPEHSIQPVAALPFFEEVAHSHAPQPELLAHTIILKLNGGLGTSMGLDCAKSLLPVKNGLTFLDFIARQVLHLRQQHRVPLRFLLMNSFSTSRDTLEFLRKYPELGAPDALELMQNQVPKIDARTLKPAVWPQNPRLEWCPPGHGDLYPSLLGSGWLDRLLEADVRYLFVSNSDNLGASLDLRLLSYFADSGKSFLMEVAERTPSDRKGGHLAARDGKLLLRESAQCPEEDTTAFQDIQRYRFFNTNTLWIRLDELKRLLDAHGGFLPLPLIKNTKTVDPRKKDSHPVFQLETAMGAAIELFPNAGAIVVPRARFAPVKATSDLLALRSDAYMVTTNWGVALAGQPGAQPPTIDLDAQYYRSVEQLDAMLTEGVPSLKDCTQLTVRGPVKFCAGNVFRGRVSALNPSTEPRQLPPGTYSDREVRL